MQYTRIAMTSPRIYVYKITFLEIRHYYYGVHKEKKFGEYYMGSPKTHKWMWDFYTPQIQILQFFEFSDEGYRQAREIEDRLIGPFYKTDPQCLNEHCGGNYSLEVCRKGGKKGGISTYENGTGWFSMTPEQRIEHSRKVGQKNYENGTGFFSMTPEQKSEASKKGVQTNRENRTGLFGLTTEQRIETGKKSGQKNKKNGTGIFSMTSEELSEASKKANSQVWQCTVTGHTSNAGGLSRFQKAKGIDTSNRIRIK
jgi:hypothetical protein